MVTESNGIIATNHSLIIKDLSIQECDQSKIYTFEFIQLCIIFIVSTLLNTLPFNSTIISSSSVITKKHFWFRYRWIFIISILILSLLSIMSVIIILRQLFHQEPTVIERIQISSVNLSQHYYEEPISIILQPPIDISVYDHVRDNYV